MSLETTDDSSPLRVIAAEAPLAAGTRFNHYRIVALIGRGGMGEVYRAADEQLGREVAIKVLQPAVGVAADLVREAQTLARLAHPNVVAVYGVGSAEGRVYVAMELVAGRTLRGWMSAAPRGWREVVAAYVAAGRGLAAAHAAGIVHRDFKPDNVLVGDDGRVRVVDFGLAGAAREAAAADPEKLSPALADTMRYSGALTGTPGYMAPEQYLLQEIDARADQFAFAVSLHEALYGSRPFAGLTVAELRRNVLDGRRASRRRPRGVPARLRAALDRALEVAREQRFPSLAALLAELERERRWPLPAAAVVVAAVAAVAITRVAARAHCDDGAARLAGVWGASRSAAVRAAFAGTARPYAADAFDRVARGFDGYAAGWRRTHLAICRATEVDHTRSAAAFDRGMACLEGDAVAFGQLTSRLARAPDVAALEGAPAAAAALESVAVCADPAAPSMAAPPADPARRARYEALRARVRQIAMLVLLGHPREAVGIGVPVLEEARALDEPFLLGQALGNAGFAAMQAGDLPSAERLLREGAVVAARAHDAQTEVGIWSQLIHLVSNDLGRPKDALALVPFLESAAARADVTPEVMGHVLLAVGNAYDADGASAIAEPLLAQSLVMAEALGKTSDAARAANSLGGALWGRGQLEAAEAMIRRAHELAVASYGPNHPLAASPLTNLGRLLLGENRDDEAVPALRTAIAIYERSVGENNLNVSKALQTLATIVQRREQLDEALALLGRAEVITTRLAGPEHPDMIWLTYRRGLVLRDLGRNDEAAAELERSLAIREKTQGPDSPQVAQALASLSLLRVRQHRVAEARPLVERAVDIFRRRQPGSAQLAYGLVRLAAVQLAEGKPADALASMVEGRALFEKTEEPGDSDLADVWSAEADALAALGRKAEAVAAARRALEVRKVHGTAHQQAGTRFKLAQALRAAGERTEAAAQAQQARDEFARDGALGKAELADAERFLSASGR